MPRAKHGAIEIEYETFGDPTHAAVLLINGLGSQMTRWPAPFCEKLVAKGMFPIRFDNRDTGLSTWCEGQSYSVDDMAGDGAAVLDAVGKKAAHIVGVSMGGMIAQVFACLYPERTLSLTSIMSSTGNPELPRATPEAMARLNTPAPDPSKDLDAFLDSSVEGAKVMASKYPPDAEQVRAQALSDFKRCYYPVGFQRQYAGILASPDRRPKLRTITAPTVVIHGEDDPLVPLAGGRDTAENIPGAELRIVPGVGHEMPLAVQDQFIAGILSAVARARVAA